MAEIQPIYIKSLNVADAKLYKFANIMTVTGQSIVTAFFALTIIAFTMLLMPVFTPAVLISLIAGIMLKSLKIKDRSLISVLVSLLFLLIRSRSRRSSRSNRGASTR
ncbi:MAG: hypothetical protein QXI43_00235 [Candidatus Nitrosocaldus sp.]